MPHNLKISILTCIVPLFCWDASAADRFVVPFGGITRGEGTITSPWALSHAVKTAKAGDVVYLRDRTTAGIVRPYEAMYRLAVSGTETAPIIFRAYSGEKPIIDGSKVTFPSNWGSYALLAIPSKAYLEFDGIEFRNFRTRNTSTAQGISITGTSHHITLRNCTVHHIETSMTPSNGVGNANGIGIFGTSSTVPLQQITIDHCEIHSLKTGSSESVVFNGNVANFRFTNNVVRDCNNIGVDCIGFEGTAKANDQARNGYIAGNLIYNIDSLRNPAYEGERAAGGIYVDGGKDILIEKNRVYACNIGVEVASEHRGKTASGCIVRNNWIHHCHNHGVSLGGADEASTGGATDNRILNNTLFKNGGGEVNIQANTKANVVKHNIMHAGTTRQYVVNWNRAGSQNVIDWNLYWSDSGAASANASQWSWGDTYRRGFTSWRAATGQDRNSLFADPKFIGPASTVPDLQIQQLSAAVNSGDPTHTCPPEETDMGGDTRIRDGRIDRGADEFKQIKVGIAVEDAQAAEFGADTGRIKVRRDGNFMTPLTVSLKPLGTATNGTDFNPLPASVTIPAYADSAIVELTPKTDKLTEGQETAIVNLPPNGSYLIEGSDSAVVTILDSPIDEWRRAMFGANASIPTVAGDTADPDKDGVSNLLEYALGTSPIAKNTSTSTSTPLAESGYLTFSIAKNPLAKDVEFCPEVANSLTGPWLGDAKSVIVLESNPSLFRARDATPISANRVRYMRLKVCRP